MFRFLNRFKKPKPIKELVDSSKGDSPEVTQDQGPIKLKLDHLDSLNIQEVLPIPRDNQNYLRGTKLRFNEMIEYNLLIIKEYLKDENLVFEQFTVGSRGQRRIIIGYLEDVANTEIVDDLRARIGEITAETILDTSFLERNIENSTYSPFPQLQNINRPDKAAESLLKGRIIIALEGSPEVLVAPVTFFDLIDTPEDAYTRWSVAATFFRIARFAMFLLAVSLPGFYIALTSFNPELIPTNLAFVIAANNVNNPFPIYFEAFAMMGVVEAVRLIIIRFPNILGASVALFAGITLVIAGLSSGLVGAPIVIIVTLTTITSFGIPSFDLRTSVRLIQFVTMIATSLLGIFGYAVIFFYLFIHLATLKSFGIPYMTPLAPMELSGWGQSIYRENTKMMAQDETYKPKNKIEKNEGDEQNES